VRLEVNVQVCGDAVAVDVVSIGSIRRDKNETVLTSPDRQFLGIGGTYETALDTLPIAHTIVRSFDIEEFDIPVSTGVLWFYVEEAKRQAQTAMKRLLSILDYVVLDLSLPEYESLPAEQRCDFEYHVLDGTAANELRINGQIVGWPNWQRRALVILSAVVTLGMMLVSIFFGMLPAARWIITQYPGNGRAPLVFPQDLWPLLLMLLSLTVVLTAVGIVAGVVSFVLWVAVARVFIPSSLVARFVSSRKWSGVPQWLSEAIGGYNSAQSMQRYNIWQRRG